jgi:outer membrane protein OmpA-like peptidoglycan-associated protein
MENKIRISLLSLILLISSSIWSQLDLARKEFERYEYQKSSILFIKAKENKALNATDLGKLAYAQYLCGEFDQCLLNIDELIKRKEAEPMHYLMKADSEKAKGRYKQAIETYKEYAQKEPTDNVWLDIQSCVELENAEVIIGARTSLFHKQNNKANARYVDVGFGEVFFNEIGLDSIKNSLELKPSDGAELLLMRPYLIRNNAQREISFPKKFEESAITSLTKHPVENIVLFTAISMLSDKFIEIGPHVYIGVWNETEFKVESIKEWKFGGFEDTIFTAFPVFTPKGDAVIYSILDSKNNVKSELNISNYSNKTFENPRPLDGLSSLGEEMYPCFDKGDFYFSSTGRVGYGNLDIYKAALDEKYRATNVTMLKSPINSINDDFWPSFFEDSCYFNSNRFGANVEDATWKMIDVVSIRNKFIQDSLSKIVVAKKIELWEPPYIYFNFKTNEPNTDYSFLERIASTLTEFPEIDIIIAGYTDVRGEEKTNIELSKTRALFVVEELRKRGIPIEKMHGEGRGESISKTNSTDKSPDTVHQMNRYVSILLVLHEEYLNSNRIDVK